MMTRQLFHEQFDLRERRQEYAKLYELYPDRVPLILSPPEEDVEEEDVDTDSDGRYLVGKNLMVGHFCLFLRRMLHLGSLQNDPLFLYVGSELAPTLCTFRTLQKCYQDDDGFLYMMVTHRDNLYTRGQEADSWQTDDQSKRPPRRHAPVVPEALEKRLQRIRYPSPPEPPSCAPHGHSQQGPSPLSSAPPAAAPAGTGDFSPPSDSSSARNTASAFTKKRHVAAKSSKKRHGYRCRRRMPFPPLVTSGPLRGAADGNEPPTVAAVRAEAEAAAKAADAAAKAARRRGVDGLVWPPEPRLFSDTSDSSADEDVTPVILDLQRTFILGDRWAAEGAKEKDEEEAGLVRRSTLDMGLFDAFRTNYSVVGTPKYIEEYQPPPAVNITESTFRSIPTWIKHNID